MPPPLQPSIAKTLHMENVVKGLVSDMNFVKERSLQHAARIHELFSLVEGTATKAEIHAAVAGLTYKNMSSALPAEFLSGVITHKFQGQIADENSDLHSQQQLRQPADLAERIKKLESQLAKEKKHEASGSQKVHRDITSLMRKTDGTDTQVNALESEVHHLTATMRKLVQQNTALLQRVQAQHDELEASKVQWEEFGIAPRTSQRSIRSAAMTPANHQHSTESEAETMVEDGVFDLDAQSSFLNGEMSLLVHEGSLGPTPTAVGERRMFTSNAPTPVHIIEVCNGDDVEINTTETSFHAPVMLDEILAEQDSVKTRPRKRKNHQQLDHSTLTAKAPSSEAQSLALSDVKTSHPASMSQSDTAYSHIHSPSVPDVSDAGAVANGLDDAIEVLGVDSMSLSETSASQPPAGAPHTPPHIRSGFQRTKQDRSAPVGVLGTGISSTAALDIIPTAPTRQGMQSPSEAKQTFVVDTSARPVTSATSVETIAANKMISVSAEAIAAEGLKMVETRLQQQQQHFDMELASIKDSILAEVLDRTEKGFGDRIRAVESRGVQIGTLREAVMVLSEEHQALSIAHRKMEADEKTYQNAYITGIEQISAVVEKCFAKVDEFSMETNALSVKNISTLEGNVAALQENLQELRDKVDEISFALKILPKSLAPPAPAPPDFGTIDDLLMDEDNPAKSRGSTRPGTSGQANRPDTGSHTEAVSGSGEDTMTEKALSSDAARNALVTQHQAHALASEELRSVVQEMYKLSMTVAEIKQKCERIDKASAQPITSVTVTSTKRPSSVSDGYRTDSQRGSVSARPPLSRPRPSSVSSARRSYSTSIATEAAREATEEVLEASRMRIMRNEMAALKEEVDQIRAVALNSIYIAHKSAESHLKGVDNALRTKPLKGNKISSRPATATTTTLTLDVNTTRKPQSAVQVRAASAPIGESPRKAQLNATMEKVRRSLEKDTHSDAANEWHGDGACISPRGVPPVEVDPPVKSKRVGSAGSPSRGHEKHVNRKEWTRARHQQQHSWENIQESSMDILSRVSSLDDHGVAKFGSIGSVHVGESSSSVLWDNRGVENEFNVSTYLSSQPQSPEKFAHGDDSLSAQKASWFRYHDDPPHSSLAPSMNRIRNVSPPQVQPEKRGASAHAKLTGRGHTSSAEGEHTNGENFLYKGEWSMSMSIAKTVDESIALDAKSSLLEMSGSEVPIE